MDVNLLTVSKLCSDVIYTTQIKIDEICHPVLDDILNKVHEKYHNLYDDDYTLYWCYSHDDYFKICNYLSYFAAVTLMAEGPIYLILNDCGDDRFASDEAFLRKLDRIEEKEEAERRRSKYDVKIIRPGEETESEEEEEEVSTGTRKDEDILRFARRKERPAYYYTADLTQQFRMIEDAKRGIRER